MAPLMRRSRRSSFLSFPLLAIGIALFLACQLFLAYFFLWGRKGDSDPSKDPHPVLPLGFVSLGESLPVLSIIISIVGAHDRELTKGFASLESLFDSWRDHRVPLELVVVHANALSSQSLERFGQSKPDLSVQYVRLPHDLTQAEAWNLAVQRYALGQFLSKLEFSEFVAGSVTQKVLHSLEKKLELLQSHPTAQVAFADFGLKDESVVLSSKSFLSFEAKKSVPGLNPSLDRSPLWRRTLHKEVGLFEPNYGGAAEWAFWLKAVQEGQLAMRLKEEHASFHHGAKAEVHEAEELAVISKYWLGGSVNLTSGLSTKQPGLRVLVVHEHVPFRNEGGDNRLMQVVSALLKNHHSVWYLYRGWGGKPVHRSKLEALGVHLIPDEQLSDAKFDGEIRQLRNPAKFFEHHDFDAAILSTWFYKKNDTSETLAPSIPEVYSSLMRQYNPGSCVAVLTDDVHWSRNLDSNWCPEREGYKCFQRVKDREQKVYLDADVLFTVSESDTRFLQAWLPHLPRAPVFLPYIGSVRSNHVVNQPSHREIITFVGSNHPINEAGLQWFFDSVVPILRNLLKPLPDIYLIGEGWKESPLSNPLGVWAPGLLKSDAELDKYLQRTRVFVSPMVKGTGVATKNVLAMENGIPLVTTSLGKRGLLVREHEPPMLVADDPAEFAAHIVRLFADDKLWKETSEAGTWHVKHVLNDRLLATILEGQLRACVARTRG